MKTDFLEKYLNKQIKFWTTQLRKHYNTISNKSIYGHEYSHMIITIYHTRIESYQEILDEILGR